MRKTLALGVLLGLGVAAGIAEAGNDGLDFGRIERGRYLTVVADCAACHTAPNGQPFAGGKPIETPFGNVVATNITPDKETGIGRYSDDDFVRAVTQGIRGDGAHLYPAMPYPHFTKMPRDDVLAMRAYLATLQPVQHKVVANQLSFPFDMRAGMAVWNKLYFTPGEFRRDADKSDEWNRGAYLVEGPMHCGACHTPKNLAGGEKSDEALQGSAVQGWFAPNLTGDARVGLGPWSADAVVAYLKTGHNVFAGAAGPMAEEVEKSSSRLADADLHAVAVYLKDLPGRGGAPAKPVPGSDPAMKAGAAIYADECSACHTPTGAGIAPMFPRLAGSPSVQSVDPTSLTRVVLAGVRSASTDAAPTGPGMPAFGWLLDDREAAAVLTYIRNTWGNAAAPVTAAQVADERRDLRRHPE